ncbi:MAG: S8 family serine peptidase, partial [Armatimonadetes bacterium]|nr:S8 family serine peptidase [Armatimonadota bacterium]NIM24923.1 S8 family serine peptidase [Armatimonadota bacterium]NIM68812.1 S8 family serine peptidase [Armatimonadota bacterium]NIM77059.1 S8 family serine peptidase [Armatimonadota bacterium]NIN07014.1 S8 family serine peptidase [Armatimonadota bacterium]
AFLLCATLCILSLATVASAKPSDTSSDPLAQYVAQGYDYVPDQLLVKFKPGTRASEKAAIHRKMRGKKLRESSYRAFTVVKLQKGTNVHAAAKAYGRYKKVIYAEPNYIRWASFVPNDTEYPNQWHLYNAVNKGLNVEAAWDITMGDPSVKVAVIDTGVAYENYDEDGDGFYDYLVAPDLAGTDFWRGRDFVNGDKHANDDEGHGTHVTGTIAQTTNNALGCAGVAPNVTIIPVKVLSEWGWGTTEWIVNGIYYAAYVGADVINMSLGGSCPSSSEQAACWFAYKRGVTIVAAAGNDGWEYLGFPAGYDESVIAVGATDYENNLAPYSSYGYGLDFDDQGLDVVAPGGDTSADLNLDGNPDGVLQQTL